MGKKNMSITRNKLSALIAVAIVALLLSAASWPLITKAAVTFPRELPFLNLITNEDDHQQQQQQQQQAASAAEPRQASAANTQSAFFQRLTGFDPFDYGVSVGAGADEDDTVGDNGFDTNHKLHNRSLSPVILMPGYGGSRLEAKWNKTHVEHFFCETKSDWTDIWIGIKMMMPYMIDCLIEDFRLVFDSSQNVTHNTPNVHIRVKDPDDIISVEYLNDYHLSSFAYFAPIIRKLTRKLGYKRNVNIRGAPYDFRKAPNELEDYFKQLKFTSEKMYQESESIPVTYICHSMGCNNILYFLQRQSQAWKDKYVKRIISMAAPWGGSVSALRAIALGDNLGMPYLFDEAKLNKVQRSLPSTIYLLPHRKAFGDSPLVRMNVGSSDPSKVRTIRASDYQLFFDQIHHPDGQKMYQLTKDLLGSLEAPGVEVWCLYGENLRTIGRLEFEGNFPGSQEMDLYDDGDGTVTTQSSKFCQQWSGQQSQAIHLKGFNTNHVNIIKSPEVVATIDSILSNDNVCDLENTINTNPS